MMSIKRILLILLLLVVGLLMFSIVQLFREPEKPVQVGMNLFYYFSLLLALVGLRFSMIGNHRLHPAVLVITILLSGLLTYEWLYPREILSIGNISIGLFALQFGLVLMLLVKTEGTASKVVQLIIAATTLLIASISFLKIEHELTHTVAGGLLALASISTLVFLFSRKVS